MNNGTIETLLNAGHTQKAICEYLGISETNWHLHLKKNDIIGFCALVDSYRVKTLDRLTDAALQLATGQFYITEEIQTPTGVTVHKKQIAPNCNMLQFLLYNYSKKNGEKPEHFTAPTNKDDSLQEKDTGITDEIFDFFQRVQKRYYLLH